MSEERPQTNGGRRRATLRLPVVETEAPPPPSGLSEHEVIQRAYQVVKLIEHFSRDEQAQIWAIAVSIMQVRLARLQQPRDE